MCAAEPLHLRLLAVPASASLVRERLRRWLEAQGWPQPALDDVVLAVHEAVSNAIEHGYGGRDPGDVEVIGQLATHGGSRWVALGVRDEGRWRPPGDPGFRGRGLPVMRGCMAEIELRGDDHGTEVRMQSHPVPVARAHPSMTVAAPEVRVQLPRWRS